MQFSRIRFNLLHGILLGLNLLGDQLQAAHLQLLLGCIVSVRSLFCLFRLLRQFRVFQLLLREAQPGRAAVTGFSQSTAPPWGVIMTHKPMRALFVDCSMSCSFKKGTEKPAWIVHAGLCGKLRTIFSGFHLLETVCTAALSVRKLNQRGFLHPAHQNGCWCGCHIECFGNIRTGKALLRAIVLIQRENMRRSFWLEVHSFEQMHEGLFSFFKDCFRLVEGLFFLRRDAFFNGYAVIQIEKRHDMLVQKFLHTLVESHKKHPKTSKGNRVAHKCLQCRSPMFAKIREPSKSRVRNLGKMFAIC